MTRGSTESGIEQVKPPRRKQPTWRQPVALSAFVLAAWAWDTALGHGGVSPWGWLAALVVVAGISGLTVYSARLNPLAEGADGEIDERDLLIDERPTKADTRIRAADETDLPLLQEVEQSADTLFEVAGYGRPPGPATVEELEAAACVLVAGNPPVGFIRIDLLDGEPHIEQVSVVPRLMKHGIGSALIEAGCVWARDHGFDSITLRTFADIGWNGPFYARRGFVELQPDELTPGLVRLGENELTDGVARMGRRIAMRKSLVESV